MSWEGRSDRQRLVELLETGRRSAADQEPPSRTDLARERAADATPLLVRRLGVAPRAAVVLVAVALLVLAGVLVRQAAGTGAAVTPVPVAAVRPATGPAPGPTTRPTTPSGTTAASPPAAGPALSQTPSPVVVHVVGRVRRPGVVRLPPGARVADALTAAGGAAPAADLARVNLARFVADGEQVVVPGLGEPFPAPVAGPSGGGAAGGGGATSTTASVLDLNTADGPALEALPGVGPVLAARILERRESVGPYVSVDELGEVQGIGEKLLDSLRPLVRAG